MSNNIMPVLFVGHGSPMNGIENNPFTKQFQALGNELPQPKAVLCISAHWETVGTFVTAMQNPQTIHDFGGFPRELYEVEYPAPGSPSLAEKVMQLVKSTHVNADYEWGLGHGTWTVLKHMYPNADVPVIQLSLNRKLQPEAHFKLGQELAELRKEGILIIGSGNVVHNLRMVAWDKLNEPFAYDWAEKANESIKQMVTDRDYNGLIDFRSKGTPFAYSIPTPEHYLPLLYVLSASDENDELQFFNDTIIGGSLSMLSIKLTSKQTD